MCGFFVRPAPPFFFFITSLFSFVVLFFLVRVIRSPREIITFRYLCGHLPTPIKDTSSKSLFFTRPFSRPTDVEKRCFRSRSVAKFGNGHGRRISFSRCIPKPRRVNKRWFRVGSVAKPARATRCEDTRPRIPLSAVLEHSSREMRVLGFGHAPSHHGQ